MKMPTRNMKLKVVGAMSLGVVASMAITLLIWLYMQSAAAVEVTGGAW